VIGKDQVGAIADVQAPGDAEVGLFEHFDFGDEGGGVDNDARADDDMLLWAKNAAGDELENVAVFADDDSVACVVAAGDAGDVIK